MKKILVIILSFVISMFFCIVVFSNNNINTPSIIINNINSTQNKNETFPKEVILMNYLTVKTQEVLNNPKNILVLDDVRNVLTNGILYDKIDPKTQNYYTKLREKLTRFKLSSLDRNKLLYQYNQKEAKAMQEALKPNVAGLLTTIVSTAVTKDPATAILSTGALILDRVGAYENSIAESEEVYENENWELTKGEIEDIEKLEGEMVTYCTEMVREYGISNDMALMSNDAKDFLVNQSSNNDATRITYFESNIEKYKGYPLAYLELAKSKFNKKEYKECIRYLDKYLDNHIDVFKCDDALCGALPYGLAAAENCMSGNEYIKYADKLLSIYKNILRASSQDEMPNLKFMYVVINIGLYNKTKEMKYLDQAYDQCRNHNIIPLVANQRELNKKNEHNVEEYLIQNLEALFAVADKKNLSKAERENINEILFRSEKGYEPLFYCLPLNKNYYYGEFNETFNDTIEKINASNPIFYSGNGYVAVIIKNDLVTDNSTLVLSYKDKNNQQRINMDEKEFVDEYCFYGIALDEDIDIKDINSVHITINVRNGIECKQEFDLHLIKMPFSSLDIVKDKLTLDELCEKLVNIGFNDEKIKCAGDKWQGKKKVKNVQTTPEIILNNIRAKEREVAYNNANLWNKILMYGTQVTSYSAWEKGFIFSNNMDFRLLW